MDHNQNYNQVNQSEPKDTKDNWSTVITIAVVGLVVGLLAGYAFFSNRSNSDLMTEEETATTTTDLDVEVMENDNETKTETQNFPTDTSSSIPTTGDLKITTNDQPASNRTLVANLDLSNPAWVVTFTSTEDGNAPYRIIGAQYFDAGTYTNVSAYLAETLVADQTYFVALYKDDGKVNPSSSARHIFEHDLDRPYIKDGRWIMDSFQTATQ